MRTVFYDSSDEVQQHRSDELEMLLHSSFITKKRNYSELDLVLFSSKTQQMEHIYLQNVKIMPRSIFTQNNETMLKFRTELFEVNYFCGYLWSYTDCDENYIQFLH